MEEKGTALIALFILTLFLILINTISTFALPSLQIQLLAIIVIGLALLIIGYTYKGRKLETDLIHKDDIVTAYIKKALLKHLSEDEIRQQLRHAGWQESLIDQAFRRVRFF